MLFFSLGWCTVPIRPLLKVGPTLPLGGGGLWPVGGWVTTIPMVGR